MLSRMHTAQYHTNTIPSLPNPWQCGSLFARHAACLLVVYNQHLDQISQTRYQTGTRSRSLSSILESCGQAHIVSILCQGGHSFQRSDTLAVYVLCNMAGSVVNLFSCLLHHSPRQPHSFPLHANTLHTWCNAKVSAVQTSKPLAHKLGFGPWPPSSVRTLPGS